MIDSKKRNSQALDVFTHIKKLSSFKEDEAEFWPEYMLCCASICRSPIAYSLELDDKQWREVEFYSKQELNDSDKEKLIQQSLTMVQRMTDKQFIFEPCDTKSWEMAQAFLLTFKVSSIEQSIEHIVTVVTEHKDLDRFNDVVVRTQLLSNVYNSYLNYQKSLNLSSTVSDSSLVYSLELLDDVVNQKYFKLASMTLVNELVNKFKISKASIGWKSGDYIKTIAVSHTETFDKNSEAVAELETLYEEAGDQESEILIPNFDAPPHLIDHSHRTFFRSSGLAQLITIPMYVNRVVHGAITIECSDQVLEQKEIELISISANQISPWLNELYLKDLWFGAKLINSLKNHLSWWLGPNKSLMKLSIVFFTCALLASCFVKMDFKIEANARLETDNVGFLSAPFHGFVKEVRAHSGDQIKKGDGLILLDTEELELKELEENANVIRFTREMEKARSNRKLVEMKVAMARVKQAQAELTRIKYYISQATIKSPLDGVIVDGDKVELIGSPVSKGDLLLKVANSNELYVKIKLNEKDIDWVKLTQKGRLKLISQPNEFHDVEISKIIPVAELDIHDGNVFYLKAKLLQGSKNWWRPGMSGVVYLDVGQKPILWVFLHRTVDAIRMKLWF